VVDELGNPILDECGEELKTLTAPAVVETRVLEEYGAGVTPTKWQKSFAYSDGGGNIVQTKVQAAPGDAPQRDGSGNLVYVGDVLQWAAADPRWVGTGRVIVDNKGNVVKQYEPFFSSTSDYDDEQELFNAEGWGVSAVMAYDPVGRNIETTLPDGNVQSWRYSPWRVEAFDEEDNRSGGDHENTPSVTHLDAQGRVYKSWAFLDKTAYLAEYPDHPEHDDTLSEDPEHSDHEANLLKTVLVLDIQGNPREVQASEDVASVALTPLQGQRPDVLGRARSPGSRG